MSICHSHELSSLTRTAIWVLAGFIFASLTPVASPADDALSSRERISFNREWLFTKGDPDGSEGKLKYDFIKPWLIASGSDLSINTPPVSRPNGNLGADVPYTQPDFNDRDWRNLNLPHDWGVEGPFKQEYPGNTGKLPWWGVAWYRKHFTLPAGDAGKQIYLDVDGAMSYAVVWLNRHFVGGWPYGYTSWRVNLTPYLNGKSGDEAELFLNGKSRGRKKRSAFEYRLRWDNVIYQPGKLMAVAYLHGEKWAREAVQTAGPAEKLAIQPDHDSLRCNGQDLSYVTIFVEDAYGHMVPRANNRIRFEISGPGEIVATDNGDPTDLTVFSSLERNAFNGMALVIVRSKLGQSGMILIKAKSNGLVSAVAQLTVRPNQ
jgi:hypothetical protein